MKEIYKLGSGGWEDEFALDNRDAISLCAKKVHHYFNLPEEIESIEVETSTTKLANSYLVKLSRPHKGVIGGINFLDLKSGKKGGNYLYQVTARHYYDIYGTEPFYVRVNIDE